MKHKYQFRVDGRRAGPMRDTYAEAANDAVNNGFASRWGNKVYLSEEAGAEIATFVVSK